MKRNASKKREKTKKKRNASKRDQRHCRSRHRPTRSFRVCEVHLATLKVAMMKVVHWHVYKTSPNQNTMFQVCCNRLGAHGSCESKLAHELRHRKYTCGSLHRMSRHFNKSSRRECFLTVPSKGHFCFWIAFCVTQKALQRHTWLTCLTCVAECSKRSQSRL